jgi:hypothetical protein
LIGKVTRGTKVAGILYYLYGPGRKNEHRDPHLVAGWRDPADLEPPIRPNGRRDYRYLCSLLDQTVTALGPYNHAQPVWHCSLRAAPEDPILSDGRWTQIAGEFMHGMGLAPYGDHGAVRWVAVRHADDHIHIVTTLAREDGTPPAIWGDYDRVMSVCRTIEARHGLRVAPAGDRTAAKTAGRAEVEKAIRLGRTDPPKDVIRRSVTTAAAGARSEADFFERLAESGLLVRRRHSRGGGAGRAEGYAVALPGHTDASGEPIWYGGYRLAADLSLPKLRSRWPGSRPRLPGGRPADRTMPGPVDGERLSARTARAVLRTTVADAADRSAGEAEFFGRLADRGLLLRMRYSEVNPGEVTGYAVALPGRTRPPDGQPDWCPGSHLADRLSLQKLRERWGSGHDRGSAERFTFEERQALYDDAARAAGFATDQIRRFGRFDPARAADAAWAASDVLHTAAKALGNPHLRAAADAYDRAAREPYAKIPSPTPAGNALRTIARVFVLVGLIEDRTSRTLLQFLIQLTALMDAVVGLRALQHRDVQASAAAQASRHFPNSPSPACPSEEAAGFMRLATADFPMDITASLQMQQAAAGQRQSSPAPSPGHSRRPGR